MSTHNAGGFSLVEILIVATMLAIVTGYGVIQVSRALELHRLETAGAILSSKLLDTRMNAIKRNRSASLIISSTTRTLQIRTTDSNGANISVGPAEPLPQGISIGSTPAQITFSSLGRLTTSQTVTLTNAAGGSKGLTISPAGKISISTIH